MATTYIRTTARVVAPSESFRIEVSAIAKGPISSIVWRGLNTGVAALDKPHKIKGTLPGETLADFSFETISFKKTGTYRFGLWVNNATVGRTCKVEVREDISLVEQVKRVKAKYSKSKKWQDWILSDEIRPRYEGAWKRSRLFPTTARVHYHYFDKPIDYSPPWSSEQQHMKALEKLAIAAFPGLNFSFVFKAQPEAPSTIKPDVTLTAGIPTNSSHATIGGDKLVLHFEPILAHEFGHNLSLLHHYNDDDPDLTTKFVFPAEPKCTMARNANQYCAGCRAALALDLNADTTKKYQALADDINNRYSEEYNHPPSR